MYNFTLETPRASSVSPEAEKKIGLKLIPQLFIKLDLKYNSPHMVDS